MDSCVFFDLDEIRGNPLAKSANNATIALRQIEGTLKSAL